MDFLVSAECVQESLEDCWLSWSGLFSSLLRAWSLSWDGLFLLQGSSHPGFRVSSCCSSTLQGEKKGGLWDLHSGVSWWCFCFIALVKPGALPSPNDLHVVEKQVHLLLIIFFFRWSIGDLPCYVLLYSKVIRLYMYVIFWYFFPLWCVIGYWI